MLRYQTESQTCKRSTNERAADEVGPWTTSRRESVTTVSTSSRDRKYTPQICASTRPVRRGAVPA